MDYTSFTIFCFKTIMIVSKLFQKTLFKLLCKKKRDEGERQILVIEKN